VPPCNTRTPQIRCGSVTPDDCTGLCRADLCMLRHTSHQPNPTRNITKYHRKYCRCTQRLQILPASPASGPVTATIRVRRQLPNDNGILWGALGHGAKLKSVLQVSPLHPPSLIPEIVALHVYGYFRHWWVLVQPHLRISQIPRRALSTDLPRMCQVNADRRSLTTTLWITT
jgi:hypothetical protein